MRTKILITGGYGFIGTNLINQLDTEEYEIAVLDNSSHGQFFEGIHNKCSRIFDVDIRNRDHVFDAVRYFKPDITFHFAGLVSIYDCHKYPEEAVSNNIVGSANVFDALISAGCPRVAFAETSAVYEDSELPRTGYHEGQSDPRTMYSSTKAAVATLAESYAKTRGLKYTALRYFNVAGPIQDYNRTVPPLFAGVALRLLGGNNPIIFGDASRRRDFIHVDDVNAFHKRCLTDVRTIGQTYNLGTGKSNSLSEICEKVHTYLIAKSNIECTALIYDKLPEINGEAHTIYADIRKAQAIGWEPLFSIECQIADTVEYLLKEIAAGSVDPNTFMVDLNTDEVKI